jgi:hypothetical protein
VTARWASSQVVVFLLVLGAALVTVRTSFRHNPTLPGDSAWQLTCKTDFHARRSGAQLRVSFPENTRHARIFNEPKIETDLSAVRRRPSHVLGKKDMLFRASKPGQYQCKIQFEIHMSRRGVFRPDQLETAITADDRAKDLSAEKGIQVTSPAVTDTLKRLLEGQVSRDDLVERLFEHCLSDIMPGGEDAPQDAAEALAKGSASPLGRARALVALCRASKIPARLVTGFEMKVGSDIRPHTWVEILSEGRWEGYDPENGFAREIPYYFVPVRHDATDLVTASEASDLTQRYSIARLPPPAGPIDPRGRHPLDMLDLLQLPAKLHEAMSLILLLPLGALVTAVVRTIIGIRTFGTFTPTLLALAFIYNDWQTGLVVFVVVLVMGFTSRTLLDRLKLLMVPRLGIILTLVVLLMVFSVSALNYFRITAGAQTVLLPMVILTNLVERFYITSEEDSLHFAGQLLATTVAMAFVVYLLLRWQAVGRIMLEYPELHCFTIAALVLVGRYTGYRWTELVRFRDVAPPHGGDAQP